MAWAVADGRGSPAYFRQFKAARALRFVSYAGWVTAERQLGSFIAKFSPEVASVARSILETVRKRYPTAIELVYDNYNALAIGFGPSERASQAIFSIANFPKWVSLFFASKGLPDPDGILQGNGNIARHIRVPSGAILDELSVKT